MSTMGRDSFARRLLDAIRMLRGSRDPLEIQVAALSEPTDKDELSEKDKHTINVILAEFAGLRGEIASRVVLQITLSLTNLSISGVILGIALNDPSHNDILLLLPIVSSCITLLFLDQGRMFTYFAEYITQHISQTLQGLVKYDPDEVFIWEGWIARKQNRLVTSVPFVAAIAILSLALPIYALIATFPFRGDVNSFHAFLWCTGIVLLLLTIISAASLGPRREY